jgi:hypothetical protein
MVVLASFGLTSVFSSAAASALIGATSNGAHEAVANVAASSAVLLLLAIFSNMFPILLVLSLVTFCRLNIIFIVIHYAELDF